MRTRDPTIQTSSHQILFSLTRLATNLRITMTVAQPTKTVLSMS